MEKKQAPMTEAEKKENAFKKIIEKAKHGWPNEKNKKWRPSDIKNDWLGVVIPGKTIDRAIDNSAVRLASKSNHAIGCRLVDLDVIFRWVIP